jgi:hypothetical protein
MISRSMELLRVSFAVTLGLLLCQTVCAGHAITSRPRSGSVASASLHILGALGQESAKLALLGFIFVAVSSVVRRKSSVAVPIHPRPSDVLTQKCRTDNPSYAEDCKPCVSTKGSNASAVVEEAKNANSAKMEPNSVAGDTAYPLRNGSSAAVGQ